MKIVRTLSDDIKLGKLPLDARLPTEAALSRRFRVSRQTLREALRHMREAGLITSRQGSGSVVAGASQPRRYVHSVTSIDELFQYAATTRFVVRQSGMVVADAKLAERLGCSPGRRWLRLVGPRYISTMDLPICWVEVFIHSSFAKVEAELEKHKGSIYSLIEDRFGERIVEVRQTLRATTLSRPIATQLDSELGTPALEVERTFLSQRHKVLEVSFSTHPLGRFSYSMVMRQESKKK